MKRNRLVLLLCAGLASLAFAANCNADVIVLSNDFEDGNLAPEIGTWTNSGTTTTTAVISTSATDMTLGDAVGLFDQSLNFTYDLVSAAPLTGGQMVTFDFDVATRRTSGNSKTVFVDTLDSNGDIVVRLVLGDTGAFGNGGADRQRPGYDPTSAGDANSENSVLPGPGAPGDFWWGSDGSPATFDVVRDAHLSLTIGASSFDFSTTGAFGASYSTTGLVNRDSGTFADIASVQFTSVGVNAGVYLDNIVVVSSVPEPGSLAILGLSVLGFCGVRRRR